MLERRMRSRHAPGRHAVRLRAGVALMLAAPILVLGLGVASGHPAPSAAGFSVQVTAAPATGAVPLTVTLTAAITSGSPTLVAWTFGDGGSWSGSGVSALSVQHRYASVGTFTATATITETSGTAAGSTPVNVESGALVTAITASVPSGAAPLAVVFHALVSGGTGTYTSFAWNFGDGGVGSGPVVSYTFQHPGKFSVALDVVDSSNSSATSSLTVSVATPTGSGSPWSSLGPTTLATAGIVGAGLTFGVFYGVRRRHSARLAEGDPEEYAAVPPGAVGPLPPSLGAAGPSEEGSSVALAPAAAESSASVSASSTPSLPSSLVRPEVVAPTTALARPRRVRPPGEEPRRWSRDIVAYLGALPTLGPDDVPTLDWTQKGMSDRLHTGQNQISNVLRRLLASGVVVERLEHVQGQPRRLKVYRLTLRGEALARDIRRRRPISNPNLLRREW